MKNNTEVRHDIGARLKQSRRAAGFTQDQLAAQLALTGATISSWERGKSMPKVNEWYRLGPLLGVSLDYLVYGKQEESPLILAILGAPGVEPPAVPLPPSSFGTRARLPAS